MAQKIGSIVTYQGLPAIVTALGDNVCTVIPLTGGDLGRQHFGVEDKQLTAVESPKVPTALPGVTEAHRIRKHKPAKAIK